MLGFWKHIKMIFRDQGLWKEFESIFWFNLLVFHLCSLTVQMPHISGLGASTLKYQRMSNVANRCPCQVKSRICFDFSFNLVFNHNFKADKLRSFKAEKEGLWKNKQTFKSHLSWSEPCKWFDSWDSFNVSRGKQTLAY